MITEEKRSVVVHYWFEKAEERMTSARREFETGSLSFGMNRLYYSAFYAVSGCAVFSLAPERRYGRGSRKSASPTGRT